MTDLQNPIYTNEEKAREHIEATRWPNGPVCPHCGSISNAAKLEGKSTRTGVYKCRDCEKPFTVTVGTVFERSHIPLCKWLLAMHLMASSKKGISAHQIHRMLGITYKSAWFMCHRIREAMAPSNPAPIGGPGKTVEADETYVGAKEGNKHRGKRSGRAGPRAGKQMVFSLVERGGRVHSTHVPAVNATTLGPILWKQMRSGTHLMTDMATHYQPLSASFPKYDSVNHHIGEYVRGNVHTNTIEGYFSIFKRGMGGVYQHCSEQHLKRYLAEFDFRYNYRSGLGVEDADRANMALKGIGGKRLTYRRIGEQQEAA